MQQSTPDLLGVFVFTGEIFTILKSGQTIQSHFQCLFLIFDNQLWFGLNGNMDAVITEIEEKGLFGAVLN